MPITESCQKSSNILRGNIHLRSRSLRDAQRKTLIRPDPFQQFLFDLKCMAFKRGQWPGTQIYSCAVCHVLICVLLYLTPTYISFLWHWSCNCLYINCKMCISLYWPFLYLIRSSEFWRSADFLSIKSFYHVISVQIPSEQPCRTRLGTGSCNIVLIQCYLWAVHVARHF